MALKTIIVTGSAGLVGSECVRYFAGKGYRVVGIDGFQRQEFFGQDASTEGTASKLCRDVLGYEHFKADISYPLEHARGVELAFDMYRDTVEAVIHCAAQPSHDWAVKDPIRDFSVNALGTLNLLEATRKHCPQAAFIYMSTNKVYGDTINRLAMDERGDRMEPMGQDAAAVDEWFFRTDYTTHSLFGCSKLAADLYVQEYGRYFGMNTVCFRGGCLTGPAHAGTKLHGFLSYLVKCCVTGTPYEVIGYGGKQVRDNIHSADLVTAFDAFIQDPKQGAVYNIGGGRENSCSVLEAIELTEEIVGKEMVVTFKYEPRIGDHKWWITDMSKFKADYPDWKITKSLRDIIGEIAAAYQAKGVAA